MSAILWFLLYAAIAFGGWTYFTNTSSAQRSRHAFHFFTVLFIIGAIGFLYELLSTGSLPIPALG